MIEEIREIGGVKHAVDQAGSQLQKRAFRATCGYSTGQSYSYGEKDAYSSPPEAVYVATDGTLSVQKLLVDAATATTTSFQEGSTGNGSGQKCMVTFNLTNKTKEIQEITLYFNVTSNTNACVIWLIAEGETETTLSPLFKRTYYYSTPINLGRGRSR